MLNNGMTERFKVEFLDEAAEFMEGLDGKAREKIYFNIRKAQIINDAELFKKLTDNILEFRTLFNKIHYRLFAFWDRTSGENIVVIATHGLVKKTDKTPLTDIDKAERIRRRYFLQKE